MRVLLLTCGLVALCAIFLVYGAAPSAQAYPLPGTGGMAAGSTSYADGSTTTNTFNVGSSWNQLTEPFQNFLNTMGTIQPTDIFHFNSPTTLNIQIPQQTVSIDLRSVATWISDTADAIAHWVVNWILTVIHR